MQLICMRGSAFASGGFSAGARWRNSVRRIWQPASRQIRPPMKLVFGCFCVGVGHSRHQLRAIREKKREKRKKIDKRDKRMGGKMEGKQQVAHNGQNTAKKRNLIKWKTRRGKRQGNANAMVTR